MEEFKKCFDDYEISNLGNCRRKQKNGEYKYIKGSLASGGYKYFQVKRDGKRINKFFHHLVAEQFIGERPNGLVIDHIDINKLNNNVNNLRYVSSKENSCNTHQYRKDLPLDAKEREKRFNAENYIKHKEKRLEDIKKYYENNKERLKQYGKEYYYKNKV